VSNAADALEKLRHTQMLEQGLETDKPLEIHISVDQAKKQFIIQVSSTSLHIDENLSVSNTPLGLRYWYDRGGNQ
jgi:TNF receptor-associated protein 1